MQLFRERISSHGGEEVKCSAVAQEVPEKNAWLASEAWPVAVLKKVHPPTSLVRRILLHHRWWGLCPCLLPLLLQLGPDFRKPRPRSSTPLALPFDEPSDGESR